MRLRFSGTAGEKTKYTATSDDGNKSPCRARGRYRQKEIKDIFFHRPKPTPPPAQTLWGVLGRSVGAKRPTPPTAHHPADLLYAGGCFFEAVENSTQAVEFEKFGVTRPGHDRLQDTLRALVGKQLRELVQDNGFINFITR